MESPYDQREHDKQPTAISTAIQDPTQSPEYLQRKLYFLLEQLKVMHAVLPEYVCSYLKNIFLIVF